MCPKVIDHVLQRGFLVVASGAFEMATVGEVATKIPTLNIDEDRIDGTTAYAAIVRPVRRVSFTDEWLEDVVDDA